MDAQADEIINAVEAKGRVGKNGSNTLWRRS
jgi:hypothetical protein